MIPIFAGMDKLPSELVSKGQRGKLDRSTLYWATNWMNTIMDLRFNKMLPLVYD